MAIGEIVVIFMVVAGIVAVALRRWSQDEVHSVEHYHQSMHTLEEMRGHSSHTDGTGQAAPDSTGQATPEGNGQAAPEGNGQAAPEGNGQAAFPPPAVRVESQAVRRTDLSRLPVASAAPSPATNPAEPTVSDDEAPPPVSNPAVSIVFDDLTPRTEPEEVGSEASPQEQSRAIHAINRPRLRLGPAAVVGAVAVLIVVVILSGLHNSAPQHAKASAKTAATAPARPVHRSHGPRRPTQTTTTTTTTTTPPVVSAPTASTSHSATYQVAAPSYTLALSASSGECWVQATDASGTNLFNGLLSKGQSQTVSATGPVTVVAGAPTVFAATVNGAPVTLPAGSLAPFTLNFVRG